MMLQLAIYEQMSLRSRNFPMNNRVRRSITSAKDQASLTFVNVRFVPNAFINCPSSSANCLWSAALAALALSRVITSIFLNCPSLVLEVSEPAILLMKNIHQKLLID